jgi:predicted dehydrogenase
MGLSFSTKRLQRLGLHTLRVGLVGCGRNSDNHLRVYAHTPNVRLVAVCDDVEANAQAKARMFGAEHAFTSFAAMLRLDLDLVDVVTPTPTHAPLAIQALESDHSVLVEKPMSLTSRECQDMIAASRRSGRSLSVCHNKRFYDSVLKTKLAVEEEKMKVSRMRLAHFFIFSDLRPNWILTEESGGILWEAMVHHVYLLQHFLGQIDRVHALARRVRNPVYDSLTLLTQSQGRAGLGEYERSANAPLLAFQLFTEGGDRFDGDLFEDYVLRFPPRHRRGIPGPVRRLSDELAVPVQKWRSRVRRSVRLPSYGVVTPYKRTFYTLIREYLSFLAGNQSSVPVPAEEGLHTVRVLEAAKTSIETSEPQPVIE